MITLYLMEIEEKEDKFKFEKIYYKYRKLMKYIAFDILKDEQLAEDAVQESFIRLTRHLNRIEEVDSYKTKAFIILIIKSAAIDLSRKEKKQYLEVLHENLENFSTSVTVEDNIETNEIAAKINELPIIYRDILQLKVYHNLSDKEIADVLKISNSAVRKRLERARKTFEKILKGGARNEVSVGKSV